MGEHAAAVGLRVRQYHAGERRRGHRRPGEHPGTAPAVQAETVHDHPARAQDAPHLQDAERPEGQQDPQHLNGTDDEHHGRHGEGHDQ